MAMAPLVAAKVESPQPSRKVAENRGWTVDSLKIPEVSYQSLFSDDVKAEEQDSTILANIDKILSSSSPRFIKIVIFQSPILKTNAITSITSTPKSSNVSLPPSSIIPSVAPTRLSTSRPTTMTPHVTSASQITTPLRFSFRTSTTPSTTTLFKSRASTVSKAQASTHGPLPSPHWRH